MTLKQVLNKLAENNDGLLLQNAEGTFAPGGLLNTLSETKLKIQAYYQPGLYIAEINQSGYLGAVLFSVKNEE